MKTRIEFNEISPKLIDGLARIEKYVSTTGLDPKLLELIKLRVSQINGCAYCLDMHHKEAISLGEEELRLHSLPAWRECPFYNDQERSALAFAEAITMTTNHSLADNIYEELQKHFSKEQIVALTAQVVNINSWNRLNHVFRPVPGEYRVGQFETANV